MGIARQLYQLQELDQEIDSEERVLKSKTSQLGESQALLTTRSTFVSAQQHLEGLKKKQRSAETDVEDLTSKIKVIDEKLYGGRIRNPKELSDLQAEGNILKAKRDQLETRALELMEQVEATEAAVVTASGHFKRTESEWQDQQKQLSVEIEQLKNKLVSLKQSRQQLAETIDPETIKLYEKLRKQKGQALARIEQGICRGCRISLSSNEIQQTRSGNMVQCSSCGRILFLP